MRVKISNECTKGDPLEDDCDDRSSDVLNLIENCTNLWSLGYGKGMDYDLVLICIQGDFSSIRRFRINTMMCKAYLHTHS
jgi:hypothetical protein